MTIRQKQLIRKTRINIILSVLLLTGTALTMFSIYIFHKTFIPFSSPVVIYLISGIIFTMFLFRVWSTYFLKIHVLVQLFWNTFFFGSIICYLFLATNYYNRFGNLKTIRYKIMRKSEIVRSDRGHADIGIPRIGITGIEGAKELIFPFSENYNMSESDSISLTIQTRALGYDAIIAYEFIKPINIYHN